jgi:hypothetical protein
MSGVGIDAKNWTNDMGVRSGPRPQEGVQNHFFPLCGGTYPDKDPPKALLTLKTIDSSLEIKTIPNLRKKLAYHQFYCVP